MYLNWGVCQTLEREAAPTTDGGLECTDTFTKIRLQNVDFAFETVFSSLIRQIDFREFVARYIASKESLNSAMWHQ